MSQILVTGVSGFVGKHLVRELRARNYKVIGVGLQQQADPEIADQLESYAACDLTNPKQVSNLPLGGVDGVISLAGLAQVGASFDSPETYKKINVAVLTVLAERILNESRTIRVLAVSTGAVYDSAQELPLKETSALTSGGSPYAQSKIQMEMAASQLRAKGLDCVIARPFNHIGPGQEPGFLVPDLYTKINESLRTGDPVLVGNLKTRRDYTDVRDVVRAYADLITLSEWKSDIYNICSGRSLAGAKILQFLLKASGAEGKVKIEVDQSLIRPNDPLELYGSHERLSHDTGWEPQLEIEQTIKDFVENQ